MILAEPVKDVHGSILINQQTHISRSILVELIGLGTQPNFVVEPIKVIHRVKFGLHSDQ